MQFLRDQGLDKTHFAMYEPHLGTPDWLNFPAVTDLPDEAYCDNWVADNGLRFLDAFPQGKPWHLVVNFVGPHGPFDVTADMRSRWESVQLPGPVGADDPASDVVRCRRQNYAAMIENIDRQVGSMIERVAQRGELDNTIIVYASDHGEMLGDHGRWGKSVWYTPASGIPLIVSGPGMRSGACSDALVSLHDLAATFLDYAQADPLPDSDARTLRAPLERDGAKHRDYVISGLENWSMIFDGRYKCVHGASDSLMLFDLQEDPHELNDCHQAHTDISGHLLATLQAETKQSCAH